jgi:PKD repeat protein
MRCCLKWLGLALALVVILVAGSVNYAQLQLGKDKGVAAAQFTIDGKGTVRLKIYATLAEGKQIRVTIGQNEITFTWTAENAKDGFLDTGHLEISGSEVLVQLLDVGAPNRCQIPIKQIPTATWQHFCYDSLAPETRAVRSPEANSYGWNRTDVTITLQAEDNKDGSGVKEICYRLSGATTQSLTCQAGSRVLLTISNEGTTTVSYFARDESDNQEPEKSLDVRIDKTQPSISASRSPSPNAYGWNNSNVTVSFQCSDGLSGVASCSTDRTVSSEGRDQAITGYAEDRAGNTSSTTVYVSIDKTRPSISLSPSSGSYTSSFTAQWSVSDSLSGVESCSVYVDGSFYSSSCDGSYTFSSYGSRSIEVRASDRAGNSNSDSRSFTLVQPARPPSASFYCSPSSGRVPLTISCYDRSSGDITSWYWEFGDGGTSTERNPSHTYYRPGTYTVRLTVRGPGGSDWATQTIQVSPASSSPRITSIAAGGICLPFVGCQMAYDISFEDPDGDIRYLRHSWTGPSSGSNETYVGGSLSGKTSGVLTVAWVLCEPANVTWYDTFVLIDSEGNRSNAYSITTSGYANCKDFVIVGVR